MNPTNPANNPTLSAGLRAAQLGAALFCEEIADAGAEVGSSIWPAKAVLHENHTHFANDGRTYSVTVTVTVEMQAIRLPKKPEQPK
jgi:hypothetical protein